MTRPHDAEVLGIDMGETAEPRGLSTAATSSGGSVRALLRSAPGRRASPLPWVMMMPSLLLTGLIIGLPIIYLGWTSLHQVTHFGQLRGFNGMANFTAVLHDPRFYAALGRTVIWTVAVVVGTLVVSLPTALLLSREFYGREIARMIVLLPWSMSLTMTAVVWMWALNGRAGLFNVSLLDLGILEKPVEWLGTPRLAFTAEILIGIIVSVPFTSSVFLSGLSSLSREVFEAAHVDGAGRWQIFRHITLPLLKPFIDLVIVLNVIYVFNSFPIIWVMTGGGPAEGTDILVTYLYKLAFRFGELGKASVMSLATFLCLLVFAVLYVSIRSRSDARATRAEAAA